MKYVKKKIAHLESTLSNDRIVISKMEKHQNQLSEQITQLNSKRNLEIQKLIQNNIDLINKNNQQSSQIDNLLKTIKDEKCKIEEQNKKNSRPNSITTSSKTKTRLSTGDPDLDSLWIRQGYTIIYKKQSKKG